VKEKELGFWVVIVGIVAILGALWLVLGRFAVATDVSAVLGPVTTAIAGLGGAFFGISLGQAGKAASDTEKDKAQKRAEFYASRLDPAIAETTFREADALT